jgi:hypothetical protein
MRQILDSRQKKLSTGNAVLDQRHPPKPPGAASVSCAVTLVITRWWPAQRTNGLRQAMHAFSYAFKVCSVLLPGFQDPSKSVLFH